MRSTTPAGCITLSHQWLTVASPVQPAIAVLAWLAVVDAIAVANVKAGLGAVPPDCMLDEPRENPREAAVEAPGIEAGRYVSDDVGAAVRLIAAKAVWMTRPEPMQDTGAVQKIVHQGVDGDHVSASFGPARVLAAQEQIGQRHRQDLVRYAVDVPQRPNNGFAHADRPVRV